MKAAKKIAHQEKHQKQPKLHGPKGDKKIMAKAKKILGKGHKAKVRD